MATAAPHVLDVTVGNALRRHAVRQEIDADRLNRAVGQLACFPLRRFGHRAEVVLV